MLYKKAAFRQFCCCTAYFVMLYQCTVLQFKYIGSGVSDLDYSNAKACLCSVKLMPWWPVNHPLVCMTRFLKLSRTCLVWDPFTLDSTPAHMTTVTYSIPIMYRSYSDCMDHAATDAKVPNKMQQDNQIITTFLPTWHMKLCKRFSACY